MVSEESESKTKSQYPLLFGFRDVIAGRGFLADVRFEGHALLVEEEPDAFWLYGVQPGGFAGTGSDMSQAYADFREVHRLILYDIAHSAKTFDLFQREVENYCQTVDDNARAVWKELVAAVREGRLELENLPKVNSDTRPARCDIREIALTPDMNEDAIHPVVVSGGSEKQLAA